MKLSSDLEKLLNKLGLMERLRFLNCNETAFEGCMGMLENVLYQGQLQSSLKEAIVEKLFLEEVSNIVKLSDYLELENELGKNCWLFIKGQEYDEVKIGRDIEMELCALKCICDSTFSVFKALEAKAS